VIPGIVAGLVATRCSITRRGSWSATRSREPCGPTRRRACSASARRSRSGRR
jgi:hypothetical protein